MTVLNRVNGNCGSFQAGQRGIANRSARCLDRKPREPGPIIVALTRARRVPHIAADVVMIASR
jgi:hypothetical protein